jgi:hypothetical protein
MDHSDLEIARRSFDELLGQPLSDIWMYCEFAAFFIGPQRKERNKRGREHWTSDRRLSIACPWSVWKDGAFSISILNLGQKGVSAGEAGDNFLKRLELETTFIEGVQVDTMGAIKIVLSDGAILSASPTQEKRGDQWLLFLQDRMTLIYGVDEALSAYLTVLPEEK